MAVTGDVPVDRHLEQGRVRVNHATELKAGR
ncbi:hypothetical protein ABID95_000258 [Streptomyces atratus]